MKVLDNSLVRQIEAHLAGLPRASEEFGENYIYKADYERRHNQVFDSTNYEQFKEAQQLQALGPSERQAELLRRRGGAAERRERALEAREEQVDAALSQIKRKHMDLGFRGLADDAQNEKLNREFEEKMLRMDWDKEQEPVMYLLSRYGEREAREYLHQVLPVEGELEELQYRDLSGTHA